MRTNGLNPTTNQPTKFGVSATICFEGFFFFKHMSKKSKKFSNKRSAVILNPPYFNWNNIDQFTKSEGKKKEEKEREKKKKLTYLT